MLKLYQSVYSGALTLIGMLVAGEIAAILRGLGNLIGAAKLMPAEFETAAYEAVVGVDLSRPLETEEEFRIAEEVLHLPRRPSPGGAADSGLVEPGRAEEEAASNDIPGPPWTSENVGVDQTVEDEQLPDELSGRTADDGGG